MAKEEEFYTDYNYELFTDNDNDDEPSTMSECSMFLVQHMIDDEVVSSLMTPQRLIDCINMDDCYGESYEIFDCMSEFGKAKPLRYPLRYKSWQPVFLYFSVSYPTRTNRPSNRSVVLFFCLFFSLSFLLFHLFFSIYFFVLFSVFLQTLLLIRQEFQYPEKCSF